VQRTTEAAAPAAKRSALLAAVAVIVVVLAAVNVADHVVPGASLWIGPPLAIALLAAARLWGLSWHDLGLGADRFGTGVRWSAVVVAVVAVVYLAAVLVPATRSAFLDSRYHTGVGEALLKALVVIPFGTVLLEEVAFRSVLWGVLRQRFATVWVAVVTSILFGVWHVLPSLHLAGDNAGVRGLVRGAGADAEAVTVLATVLFTAVGGLVFAELRRRTQSLLPCVCAHWATNGLGVLFGVLAWHLAR
jgi:uncharacterized protein